MFRKIAKASIYLLAFLLPLFWLPFTLDAFDFNKVYLLFFLTSIGIVAWIGEMIFKKKQIKFRRTPLDLFVVGFALITVLSAVFSVDKTASLLGSYGRFWPSLLGILSLCGYYFLLTNFVSFKQEETEKDKSNSSRKTKITREKISGISLLKTFLGSSFLVVLIGFLSVFGVFAKIGRSVGRFPLVMKFNGFNTISGSLEGLAMFLGFIVVLTVTLISFRGKIKGLIDHKKSHFGFYTLLFSTLILLFIIGFRFVWLSMALSLAVFLFVVFWKRIFKKDVHKLDLPVVFLIIAIIFIFSNPFKGLLTQVSALRNLPYELIPSQRLSWSIDARGFKDNLVLGSGPGTFSYLFNKFKPQAFLKNPGNLWQLRLDRSGSHIAEVFGTSGILGTLAYLALIGMFFLLFYLFLASLRVSHSRNGKKEKNSEQENGNSDDSNAIDQKSGVVSILEERLIAIPFLISFLTLIFAQIFYYQNATLAFGFWFILALGVLSLTPKTREKTFSFSDFPEIGLILSICFWVVTVVFLFVYFNLSKYYLADVYYRNYLQKPAANTQKLEAAARMASKRSTYHIVLARDYLRRFNEEIAKKKPRQQVASNMAALALREAKQAALISPNRVSAQETLSVVYRDIRGVAAGALQWSIKSFEKAVKLEPKNPALLTEFGKLVASGNDKEKAKKLFQEAINMKGDYLDAHIQLALLTEAEKKPKEAQKILENAVSLNPQSVEAHFQLGRMYYNNKENAKAEKELRAALAIFPNHSNSLYSLALIYEKQGKKKEAIKLLERVLELNPGNQDIMDKINKLKGGIKVPVESNPNPAKSNPGSPEEEK